MNSSASHAVLDLRILTDMYDEHSTQQVCQILGGFRSEATLYISQLQQALTAQDCAEVARFSHSLKSMCGLIGACQMMTLCQTTEQAARQGDNAALGRCRHQLALVWPLLLLQLQSYLQQHGCGDA